MRLTGQAVGPEYGREPLAVHNIANDRSVVSFDRLPDQEPIIDVHSETYRVKDDRRRTAGLLGL